MIASLRNKVFAHSRTIPKYLLENPDAPWPVCFRNYCLAEKSKRPHRYTQITDSFEAVRVLLLKLPCAWIGLQSLLLMIDVPYSINPNITQGHSMTYLASDWAPSALK